MESLLDPAGCWGQLSLAPCKEMGGDNCSWLPGKRWDHGMLVTIVTGSLAHSGALARDCITAPAILTLGPLRTGLKTD